MEKINETELLDLSREELKEWFTTDNKSGCKSTEKWLSKHQPELCKLIIENCEEDGLKFNAKVFLSDVENQIEIVVNKIKEIMNNYSITTLQ